VLLFAGQHLGTERIGNAFAPMVVIWLYFNAAVGIYNIATYSSGSGERKPAPLNTQILQGLERPPD